MNEILLVDPTEELQTLAQALEQRGFSLVPCSMAEASRRLLDGEAFAALFVNLLDAPDGSTLRDLLDTPAEQRPALVGIFRRDRVDELNIALPLDDFVTFPALPEEVAARLHRLLSRRDGETDPNLL